MILVVLEGAKTERALFKSLKKLYFVPKTEAVVCVFHNNIYNLYKKVHDDEALFVEDLVAVLREDAVIGHQLAQYKRSDFSQIYLFFDYDCHQQDSRHSITLEELNRQLGEMLSFFSDESEHGKLFISYPMVEALRYTKRLPDANFRQYVVPLDQCSRFKQLANGFSAYGNLDFLLVRPSHGPEGVARARSNWNQVVRQNVVKAGWLCLGEADAVPSLSAVGQEAIFAAEQKKHVRPKGEIAVLSAFPLFLYDYFGSKIVK